MLTTLYRCSLIKEREVDYPVIDSSEAAVGVLRALLADRASEAMAAVYIRGNGQVAGCEILSQGTIDQLQVTARELFRGALLTNAHGVIVGHNHPSGVAEPSAADERTTCELVAAGKIMGIDVLDHVIVSQEDTFSFRDHGFPFHKVSGVVAVGKRLVAEIFAGP